MSVWVPGIHLHRTLILGYDPAPESGACLREDSADNAPECRNGVCSNSRDKVNNFVEIDGHAGDSRKPGSFIHDPEKRDGSRAIDDALAGPLAALELCPSPLSYPPIVK